MPISYETSYTNQLIPDIKRVIRYLKLSKDAILSPYQAHQLFQCSKRLVEFFQECKREEGITDFLVPVPPLWLSDEVTDCVSIANWASRCYTISLRIITHMQPAFADTHIVYMDVREDEDGDGLQNLASELAVPTSTEALRRVGYEWIEKMVLWLPYKERTVIEHRFLLNGKPYKPDAELADELQVSRAWVGKLRSRGVAKIQRRLKKFDTKGALGLLTQ